MNQQRQETVTPEEIRRLKGLGFLHAKGTDNFNARILTKYGMVSNQQMQDITQAAQLYGDGCIALTARLTMELQGVPYSNVDSLLEFAQKHSLIVGGTGDHLRPVASCKGTTCQYGRIDTFALAEKIHDLFYEEYHEINLPHKFKIAVGGCPNNCAKPNLNDVGIVGVLPPKLEEELCRGCSTCGVSKACPMKSARVNEKKVSFGEECTQCGRCIGKCPFHAVTSTREGYKIYIGGTCGRRINHGRALNKIFTDQQEVLQTIEECILLFKECGNKKERFADTVLRLGFEEVERILLAHQVLPRKSEIIGN